MNHSLPSRGAFVRRRTAGLAVALAAVTVPVGLAAAIAHRVHEALDDGN